MKYFIFQQKQYRNQNFSKQFGRGNINEGGAKVSNFFQVAKAHAVTRISKLREEREKRDEIFQVPIEACMERKRGYSHLTLMMMSFYIIFFSSFISHIYSSQSVYCCSPHLSHFFRSFYFHSCQNVPTLIMENTSLQNQLL